MTRCFSLVTALSACPLPVSWPDQSEGMFLLASACPDENDSEDDTKNNSRGVIKLRLLTASHFLQSPADVQAKKRASAVVCSLVCDRRQSTLRLAKNLTLNMCEGADVNHNSNRAIYIVASVPGGFSAWCITAEHFSSMQKGNIQAIPSFKCSHARLSLFVHRLLTLAHTGTTCAPIRCSEICILLASCMRGLPLPTPTFIRLPLLLLPTKPSS